MPAKMQAMAAENNSQIIKYTLTRVVPRIAVRAFFMAYLCISCQLFQVVLKHRMAQLERGFQA